MPARGIAVVSKGNQQKKQKKIKPDGADGHRSRMFDKFLAAEDNCVLPRDMIEMLLYYPIKMRDTRDAAVHLMKKYGTTDKILSVNAAELSKADGIGEESALFLNAVGSVINRLSHDIDDSRKIYSNPADMCEIFFPFRDTVRGEITAVACFDNAHRIICAEKITAGILTRDKAEANELLAFISSHHTSSVAIARVTSLRTDFPGNIDFEAVKLIKHLLNSIDVPLDEYFVISREEAIGVSTLKIQ